MEEVGDVMGEPSVFPPDWVPEPTVVLLPLRGEKSLLALPLWDSMDEEEEAGGGEETDSVRGGGDLAEDNDDDPEDGVGTCAGAVLM